MPVWLSHDQAQRLAAAWEAGQSTVRVSPDLGLTMANVLLEPERAVFPKISVGRETVERISKTDKKCFFCDDDTVTEIRVFSDVTGWVRSLCPTRGAPTMLVSGIPMHRIKDTEPWADSQTKVATLRQIHGRVLDTATGLGYSAILLAQRADEVVTVELDPASLDVARLNPWSQSLFTSPRIRQLVGDCCELVRDFPTGHFSAVFHDPPTIQLAGELYSLEFYTELRRVLSRKGTLFHYIGDPSSGLGKKVTEGVIRRLHEAGFATVERCPEAFGVRARASQK